MIINQINQFALNKIPFIVIINYDISKIKIIPLELAAQEHIFYEINGKSNYDKKLDIKNDKKIKFEIFPVLYKQYLHSFNIVYQNLMRGNSYLTNLTFPTKVKTNYTLYEIFTSVSAPCKLFYKDEFVCFSPEPFVSIEDNIISSFPMKGTIDANIENAETIILNNFKEIAEHNTIVDLIRNDLNMVAENV
ncbi:MAG TPA: chorismate-binding protein, partial [Bacteroidales bacterium]|nr:chorismate-binding protein [Bacteroidales bacterium]